MKPCFIIGYLIISSLLSGCAPRGLFYWGDYEDSLYERYMEHDSSRGEAYLRTTLEEALNDRRRVPPGLYADYGFMLYQRGDKRGAIEAFENEKNLYPESNALMTKLINRIKNQTSQKNSAFDAGGKQE